MGYDAYGRWEDNGFGEDPSSMPIGATSDWASDEGGGSRMDYGGGGQDDPYGDFPDLSQVIDQPGAGQGQPGFDPYDPGTGGYYTDDNGNPFHFQTGIDQDTGDGPSQMPDGGGQGAGPWYGGSNPGGGGGFNLGDALKKLGSGILGNDKSSPRSDILRGAGISSIGQILAAILAKPNFQQRTGFSGSAAPQRLMEEQVGRLKGIQPFMTDRAQSGGINLAGLSDLQPVNPMSGMAGGGQDDEITQILKGLK